MAEITHEEQQTLLKGLRKLGELTAGGEKPDDALCKIAQEYKLPAAQVRICAEAYNNSRANQQRRENTNPFDKAGSFELADPAAIFNRLYPGEIKSAAAEERARSVSPEYLLPPYWALLRYQMPAARDAVLGKKADAELFDDVPPLQDRTRDLNYHKKIASVKAAVARKRQELRLEMIRTHDRVDDALHKLADHFRNPNNVSMADARHHAEVYYGAIVKPIFWKLARGPADPKHIPTKPFAREQAPYTTLAEIVAGAEAHREAFAKAAAFEPEAVKALFDIEHAADAGDGFQTPPAADDVSPFARLKGVKRANLNLPKPPEEDLSPVQKLWREKKADLPGSVAGGLSLGIGAGAGEGIVKKLLPDSDAKVKEDALLELSDPAHEAQLRAIRAQATLHNLLASPYFQGEQPGHVTELYNHIANLAPRVADQPLLLESAMRRYLSQGQADPHDLDQLLGLETKLKQRDEQPGRNPYESRGSE